MTAIISFVLVANAVSAEAPPNACDAHTHDLERVQARSPEGVLTMEILDATNAALDACGESDSFTMTSGDGKVPDVEVRASGGAPANYNCRGFASTLNGAITAQIFRPGELAELTENLVDSEPGVHTEQGPASYGRSYWLDGNQQDFFRETYQGSGGIFNVYAEELEDSGARSVRDFGIIYILGVPYISDVLYFSGFCNEQTPCGADVFLSHVVTDGAYINIRAVFNDC